MTVTKVTALRPGMAVTIRFTNTHIISGIYEGRDHGIIEMDTNGRRSWWKQDMVESVFRDTSVRTRR